jgi:hypothetical protein
MPFYRFKRRDTGGIVELFMTIAQLGKRQRKDHSIRLTKAEGGPAIADYDLSDWIYKGKHRVIGTLPCNYPMVSYSYGINPSQIEEASKADARLGIRVEYTKDGDIVFPDKMTRKRYLEAHGAFDRNGSYDDPQRYDSTERQIRLI